MITQEFLSQCSEDQINKGVAWLEVVNKNLSMKYNPDSEFYYYYCNAVLTNPNDYCANPNDIMPIAESCCMSIEFPHPELGDTGQVSAYIHNDTDVYVEFNDMSKYMRAIAEVYILMSVNK